MNLNNYTVKAQEIVRKALEIAAENNHQGLDPAHLLKAFLMDLNSIGVTIMQPLRHGRLSRRHWKSLRRIIIRDLIQHIC